MANKTINKRGSTLIAVVVVLLLTIGIFSGYYLFLVEQMDNYGTQLDDKYNETYQVLVNESISIDEDVNRVKESINEVQEASEGVFAAINGFKGLGAALLLLLGFIGSGVNVFTALFFSTDFFPSDVQGLLFTGLIAALVFVVISIFKGDQKLA